jgi:hypothetical protein
MIAPTPIIKTMTGRAKPFTKIKRDLIIMVIAIDFVLNKLPVLEYNEHPGICGRFQSLKRCKPKPKQFRPDPP